MSKRDEIDAPWTYEPSGDSDGEQVWMDHFVMDANGEEVCCAANEKRGRLIAAAPDLLEACQRLDEIDCCDGYELNEAGYLILWDALNKVRAAIAKAEPPK